MKIETMVKDEKVRQETIKYLNNIKDFYVSYKNIVNFVNESIGEDGINRIKESLNSYISLIDKSVSRIQEPACPIQIIYSIHEYVLDFINKHEHKYLNFANELCDKKISQDIDKSYYKSK